MSHGSQRAFIESCAAAFPEYFTHANVLDIGSGDINGSTRNLFEGGNYTGVDVVAGPGVDVVASGHEIDLGLGTFRLTLSCECMEHNPYWRETIGTMVAHLDDEGMIVITCAGPGRPEHGTQRSQPLYSLATELSWDYYKNLSEKDLAEALLRSPRKLEFRTYYRRSESDVYLVGFVGSARSDVLKRLRAFEPQWKSDKSAIMRSFHVAAGVLESYCSVSPYVLRRCLDMLQRVYTTVIR
jgi:hypothetical protein